MNETHARIRKSLAALDLVALQALANKGLVRRAQKDLERAIPISVEDSADAVRLRVAEFSVQIPEGGATKATCSCPAPGICQHILAAILWLRSQAAPDATAKDEISIEELLSITPEHLQKWAGKAAFAAGISIAIGAQYEISQSEKLSVSFPDRNLKCIYTGGGLDAWITAGPKGDPRAFVVAAVVALQIKHGRDWSAQKPAELLAESDEAPRTRSEVLASVTQLLHEILKQGIAHTSTGAVQRFSTLSVSATGVNSVGRLSGSAQINALISGKAPLLEIPRIKSWADLLPLTTRPPGLAEENPLTSIVIIEPTQWGPRAFDSVTQVFAWAVSDDQGAQLKLQLRYDSLSKVAIESLESLQLSSMKGSAVVGRVMRDHNNILIHPFALLGTNGKVSNIFLKSTAAAHQSSSGPRAIPMNPLIRSLSLKKRGPR